MSIAKHHAEWLSLIEVSGPFLSLPVLQRVFPQGLEAHDPDVAARLRVVYAEWQAEQEKRHPDPAIHRAWLRWVLSDVLEFPPELLAEGSALPPGLEARLAQEGETLVPDLALIDPETKQPALLITMLAENQALGSPLAGSRWKASPATRMMTLLHATGVPLGLVSNGEEWMLVHAPRGETAGFASWYADLWREEPITLRAFRSLLGTRRFCGVAAKDRLAALFAESAQDQQEVTEQLGYQVRRAVEVLIQAIDRIDRERGRDLLRHVSEQQLYEAALSVMMRLVFLFSAEERKLLLLGQPLYDAHYAVSTLAPQLREEADRHGEEVLERRFDAWARLLATFRAVHAGISHDLLPLPAYGGALFDPDRYPFLEGRGPGTSWRAVPAEPLPINNRTALHLLEALQYLEMRVTGGGAERRKLSFRALGIEQIGHVYEGLLDHTAKRSAEPVLGLAGAKGQEPEIALATLEAERAKGEAALVTYLVETTKRSQKAVARALSGDLSVDENRLRAACDNDGALLERIRPFAGLLRSDSHGDPVVILPGSVFVTEGSDRRSTGTHYTPTSLTEPIVRHALDPLVYRGMADGVAPTPETLIGPEEILALKVVDFACGSGAFLVQACRYLAAKLVEAWEREEQARPGVTLKVPEAAAASSAPSERVLPAETEERLAIARRLIADRCLYGVDRNAQAVEMAKLSLWLITLQKDRPFEFLDHAIKCGDTLLGVVSVEQLKAFHINPARGRELFGDGHLFDVEGVITEALADAAERRRRLESFTVTDIRDAEEKARLHGEAERALEGVRLIGDLIIGAAIANAGKPKRLDAEMGALAPLVAQAFAAATDDGLRRKLTHELRHRAQVLLNEGKPERQPPRRCLHWPVEFPEVFAAGGFDALVSNPPFQGGRLIGKTEGANYLDYICSHRGTTNGSPDICAYFFLRAFRIVGMEGGYGMIATKSLTETGNRIVGIDEIVNAGGLIRAAFDRLRWPGKASVFVHLIWIWKGEWRGRFMLNGQKVQSINSMLEQHSLHSDAHKLPSMKGLFSQGQDLMGKGFELNYDQLQELISCAERYRDIVKPLFNGDDIVNMPFMSPWRWAIYFRRMSEEEARCYPKAFDIVESRVKPYRDGLTGQIHEKRFWLYWDFRPRLVFEMEQHDRILASAVVAKYIVFRFVDTKCVYNHKTKLYFFYEYWQFAILQSSLHLEWAQHKCATLGRTTLSYSTSAALETWPFPSKTNHALMSLGENYHEFRSDLMVTRNEGPTAIYNRFHNPDETAPGIPRLRELHIEMDRAVAAAYGWDDLDLGHGFHETKQGVRFTLSEPARAEVLDRLLALNHQRYAEEVAQGLHDKTRKKPAKAKPKPAGGKPVQPDLDLGFELT